MALGLALFKFRMAFLKSNAIKRFTKYRASANGQMVQAHFGDCKVLLKCQILLLLSQPQHPCMNAIARIIGGQASRATLT